MSSGETLYTFRTAYTDVLERGRAQVVRMEVWRDGAGVTPSSGTFTLYAPDGAVVATGVAACAAGAATFSLTADQMASTLELGEGYLEEWVLTIGGVPYTARRTAVVARRKLYPVVAEEDLEAEYPDIAANLGGSVTHLQGFIDEAWKRIVKRLQVKGVLIYLVMEPDAFREAHLHLALFFTFKWFYRAQPNERWKTLYEHHLGEYRAAWGEMNWVEDRDHDGRADDEQRRAPGTLVHVNVAPRARTARNARF